MVAEVLADLGGVGQDLDAALAEVLAGADAGQHQQLRRVHGAAAQDHLAAGVDRAAAVVIEELHADGAAALEQDAGHEGAGADDEVGALAGGAQVGVGGRPAAAGVLRHGGLAGLVQAQGPAGLQEQGRRRVRGAEVLDVQGAGAAVFLAVGGGGEVLDAAEVAQHLVGAPAGAGDLAPFVVVGGQAADPHHGVDRGRPAEGLAPGPEDAAAAERGLLHRAVAPVDLGVEQLGEAGRDADQRVPVGRARLQEDDPAGRVLGEPGGERRAG
jgi:hypothetical protein